MTTFVDLGTLQPVGELGHFDPATGAGSVLVPNVAPGQWAVAAVCVEPVFDLDLLEAGIRANGAFLESLGFPTCDINSPEFAQYVEQLLGPGADIFVFLNAFGPTFIQSIVTPEALGADIQALVQAGELSKGKGNALTRLLQNVRRSLDKQNVTPACKQLAAFVKLAEKSLDDAAAADIVAQADVIDVVLGCTPPGGSPSGAFVDG